MSRPNPSDEHAAWLADEARLADDAWMRRLARGLVGDPHTADDLAQEAWLASLSESAARSRAWLAGVARNAWRDLRRSEGRRRRREHDVARDERAPDDAELVAELELRREVAERLLALPEPYRHTLWLRYFRDLSLRAIAEREGVPLPTVASRVRRGLALLREALDRSRGGRRDAWAALLVPLVRRPAAGAVAAVGTTVTIGGIAMSTGTKVAAALALAGGLLGWWWTDRGDGGAVQPVVPALAAAAPGADEQRQREGEPLVANAPQHARTSVAPAAGTDGAAPAPAPAEVVRGRVVESDGSPVPLARVAWAEDGEAIGPAVASDREGRFALAPAREERASEIVCVDPDRTTLVAGAEGPGDERVVVVAGSVAVGGVVVDPRGDPIEGAAVALRLRQALFDERGVVHSWTTPTWTTTSDAAGRFLLADACAGEHVFLEVAAPGFEPAEVDVPAQGHRALVVTLAPDEDGVRIFGTVLDPRGEPFPGARVAAGMEIATTDERGRFELLWRPDGDGNFEQSASGGWEPSYDTSRAMALAPGYLPASVLLAEVDVTAPLFLQLGAEPLSIAGRVVDEQGGPLPEVVVWTPTRTPFGEDERSRDVTVEGALAGGSDERGTTTDADGRFQLAGLLERHYELSLFDPRTATRGGAERVAAGTTGLDLVLRREPGTTRVAGHVVTLRGEPIPGVRVTPMRSEHFLIERGSPLGLAPGHRITDERGRFAFEELATEGTFLQLQETDLLFLRKVRLADHDDCANLVLVEPLLCELQVELVARPDADAELFVLDARDERLPLLELRGAIAGYAPFARVRDGRSSVLRVPETGCTLVIRRGTEEVVRRPIELDPDTRLTLRL